MNPFLVIKVQIGIPGYGHIPPLPTRKTMSGTGRWEGVSETPHREDAEQSGAEGTLEERLETKKSDQNSSFVPSLATSFFPKERICARMVSNDPTATQQ